MTWRYEKSKIIDERQLMNLYESVGWRAYTEEFDRLQTGIRHSLEVITVWHDEELVGLIRAVGDGQTIIYIQDLLIKPCFQRQGLGAILMERLLGKYPAVRQIVLMTDEAPNVRRFYESLGFKSCDQGQAVSFARFK